MADQEERLRLVPHDLERATHQRVEVGATFAHHGA